MDHCKGCTAYHETGCTFKNHNTDGTCPCTECVVKAMCDITCGDYNTWTDLKWRESHGG